MGNFPLESPLPLFALIRRLNGAALEMARHEGLRAATLFFWMGALLGDPLSGDPEARAAEPDHARELQGSRQQWHAVLEGHPVIFADAAEAWAGLRDIVERLAALAEILPPVMRLKASARGTPRVSGGSVADRSEARAQTVADDARPH